MCCRLGRNLDANIARQGQNRTWKLGTLIFVRKSC